MVKIPYFDLVLGLAALIEGLALAKIADVGAETFSAPNPDFVVTSSKLTLCFLIVFRIYQGFISISIKPIEERDLHFQMLVTLVFGVFQTIMIAAAGHRDDDMLYYVTGLIVTTLGALLHLRNIVSLRGRRLHPEPSMNVEYEIDFQTVSCVLLALASTGLVGACLDRTRTVETGVNLLSCVILSINAHLSYQLFAYNTEPVEIRTLPPSARGMAWLRGGARQTRRLEAEPGRPQEP